MTSFCNFRRAVQATSFDDCSSVLFFGLHLYIEKMSTSGSYQVVAAREVLSHVLGLSRPDVSVSGDHNFSLWCRLCGSVLGVAIKGYGGRSDVFHTLFCVKGSFLRTPRFWNWWSLRCWRCLF